MEVGANHLKSGNKSISLFYLDKNQNTLNNKIKKSKQPSLKYSLSRKKTSNLAIKNIFDEKKIKNSKIILNETPNNNIKKNINSSILKTNYSSSKVNSLKSKDIYNIGKEPKKIYTINIQLDTKTKSYLTKTKIKKKFRTKDNKKNNLKDNLNDIKKINPKTKKLLKSSITPRKNNGNNINTVAKETNKNGLFLNISNNNSNEEKNYLPSKNKFSKSVIEQPKHLHNYNTYSSKKNKDKINNINNSETNIGKNNNKKILVIDLDETLIHTSFQKIENPDLQIQLNNSIKSNSLNNNQIPTPKILDAYIRIRPGVDEFLNQMSKYYDIYVYSASSKNYLNSIIKNIDKNNIIKQCYCRNDCIMYVEDSEEDFDKPNNKYNYVKDLKKITKELKSIVFIDNNTISFKLQEKNGIPIKSWFDDYEDLELYKLIPILKNLSGFYDVRVEISKFVQNKTFIWSKSINWLVENCLNSSYLNEIYSILIKEQKRSQFQICNDDELNNSNKPKVINHINNILINLNEDSNDFNKKKNKKNQLLKKINTDFEYKKKDIEIFQNNSDIHNDDKEIFSNKSHRKKKIDKIDINKNNNIYSNSNLSQKTQKNLFKKKVIKPNHLIKNSLAHQYSICFTKNDIIQKMNLTQQKQTLKKTNINNSKVINKLFLQTQNRIIINYVNNKQNFHNKV